MFIFVSVHTAAGVPVATYWMDHDDVAQRRVLGTQCRYAFEAGQSVFTCPVSNNGVLPNFLMGD